MTNLLAFTPFEVALSVSMLIAVAIAVFLLGEAARSRLRWLPAIITAVLAVAVPFVGPAVALFICWKLSQVRRKGTTNDGIRPVEGRIVTSASILIVLWLGIGWLAAFQLGYFDKDGCSTVTDDALTVFLGPLNYADSDHGWGQCVIPL